LADNFANKLQLPYLRIPGTDRYWSALNSRLADFLSDQVATAEEALQHVADDWNGITDDLDRESQRLSYLTTLGLPPPASND
jgi:multiple sugar transport system substrate-binding protein